MPLLARENPFATDHVLQVRYRFLDGNWDTLLARGNEAKWRGAIIGPEGSGKTTLLEDLRDRLHAAGHKTAWLRGRFSPPWLHKRGWSTLARSITSQTIVFIDSAECIPPPLWWFIRLVCIRAKGLLITLHQPGRLPALHYTRTTPALLKEIVFQLSRQTAVDSRLFETNHGDIRAALRQLYDDAAGLSSTPGHSVSVTRD